MVSAPGQTERGIWSMKSTFKDSRHFDRWLLVSEETSYAPVHGPAHKSFGTPQWCRPFTRGNATVTKSNRECRSEASSAFGVQQRAHIWLRLRQEQRMRTVGKLSINARVASRLRAHRGDIARAHEAHLLLAQSENCQQP
jgi:hypothetical protein